MDMQCFDPEWVIGIFLMNCFNTTFVTQFLKHFMWLKQIFGAVFPVHNLTAFPYNLFSYL